MAMAGSARRTIFDIFIPLPFLGFGREPASAIGLREKLEAEVTNTAPRPSRKGDPREAIPTGTESAAKGTLFDKFRPFEASATRHRFYSSRHARLTRDRGSEAERLLEASVQPRVRRAPSTDSLSSSAPIAGGGPDRIHPPSRL